MNEIISDMIEDVLSKSKNFSEIISQVWKNTYYFMNHFDEGKKLIDALYFVEIRSTGDLDLIPKEKINSRQWKRFYRILRKFCDKYKAILKFNNLPILMEKMTNNPEKVQLCTVYTHIFNIWQDVYKDELSYKLLRETALLGSFRLRYIHCIYDAFEKDVA